MFKSCPIFHTCLPSNISRDVVWAHLRNCYSGATYIQWFYAFRETTEEMWNNMYVGPKKQYQQHEHLQDLDLDIPTYILYPFSGGWKGRRRLEKFVHTSSRSNLIKKHKSKSNFSLETIPFYFKFSLLGALKVIVSSNNILLSASFGVLWTEKWKIWINAVFFSVSQACWST